MKTVIQTAFIAAAFGMAFTFSSCEEKKGKAEADKEGIEINGKKGGELDVDKDGLHIEGKKGGELNIDKEGVEAEGQDKK